MRAVHKKVLAQRVIRRSIKVHIKTKTGPRVKRPIRTVPTGVGEHKTVHERTYTKLRELIAGGELPPGAPLSLRPLANRLGVSKMPVVEAIRRLERDGLITVVPRLGAKVKEWSSDEVTEAYHIRRALESEAARLFVMRASRADKEKLVQLNDIFDRLASAASLACNEADIRFHMHIVRATRYPHLIKLVENSRVHTALQYAFRWSPDELAQNYKSSVGIHRSLVKVLLGNDPEAAEREMKRCIDRLVTKIEELDKRNEETEILSIKS